ncbi:hypothetical protein QE152_g41544, partial [Popillia japonica]
IDDDGVLGTAGSVKLLDAQGNSIDDWNSTELNPDENGELEFVGDAEYTVYWDSLNPDTQYRLVELEFVGDAEYTVYWDSLNPDTQYRLVVSSNYGEAGGEGDTGEDGEAGDEGSQGRTGTDGATGSSGELGSQRCIRRKRRCRNGYG